MSRTPETTELTKQYNQYSKRIGSTLVLQRKLLKSKEKLTNFKEPLLLLERNNGEGEWYHDVRETEWFVPNTDEGVEKKILLGKPWQKHFNYAGRRVAYYDCHEDWVFPHIWGKPQRYQGHVKDAPNQGWILEQANMASEVFRDRERKVLMAWEKFQAKAGKKDWMEIAKAIAIVLAVIVGLLWAWNQFGGGGADPVPVMQQAVGGVTLG